MVAPRHGTPHRYRLALASRELVDGLLDRGDGDAQSLEDLAGLGVHPSPVQPSQPPEHTPPHDKFSVEEKVRSDVEGVDQRQILVDGLDAQPAGSLRAIDPYFGAVDHDGARVGCKAPGNAVDNGRLARAVVTQKAEHFAMSQLEAHIPGGFDRAKRLR